jgi:hypothetical protein
LSGLTWNEVISFYEKRVEESSSRSLFALGMLQISKQIQADTSLPPIKLNLQKNMLILIPEDLPDNLPPGFPATVGIYWTEPDHYRISIGLYEAMIVPAEKANFTIKYQSERVRNLLTELNLSGAEVQEWTERYRRKLKDDIEYLYSKQPKEWIITNLLLDIPYHVRQLLRITGEIERAVKSGDMSEEKAQKAYKEALEVYRNVVDILYIAHDIETEHRSKVFLKENFE